MDKVLEREYECDTGALMEVRDCSRVRGRWVGGGCDAGVAFKARRGGFAARRCDAGARGASVVRCVIDYTDVDALTVKRALYR